MPKLILASTSPRRRDALKQLGISFTPVANHIDEKKEIENSVATPETIALHLSHLKAQAVASRYPQDFILGMDTLVAVENDLIGKPAGEKDAARMLRQLSGIWHRVITGLTLCNKERRYLQQEVVCTRVKFRNLSEQCIREYLAVGESLDKAGAYGIQSAGKRLVEKVDGDLSNVVGFPEHTVLAMLKQAGFSLQYVESKLNLRNQV
jgi:septum formation protein